MTATHDIPRSALLRTTDHRPWPVPSRPWVLRMTWRDLLFLHRPISVEAVRSLVPPELEVDTFEGRAWIGVVPFEMCDVAPRLAPALPGVSRFPELNVRTYVRYRDRNGDERPGVWFFSLDASSRLSVRTARAFFHLPYFDARMSIERWSDSVHYVSTRTHRGAPAGRFQATYRPVGEPYRSRPGSLDHWLTERYCLYSADRRGRLFRGHIQHAPWPLQPAEVEVECDTMARAAGFDLSMESGTGGEPPVAHYARELPVVAWWLEKVATERGT